MRENAGVRAWTIFSLAGFLFGKPKKDIDTRSGTLNGGGGEPLSRFKGLSVSAPYRTSLLSCLPHESVLVVSKESNASEGKLSKQGTTN